MAMMDRSGWSGIDIIDYIGLDLIEVEEEGESKRAQKGDQKKWSSRPSTLLKSGRAQPHRSGGRQGRWPSTRRESESERRRGGRGANSE